TGSGSRPAGTPCSPGQPRTPMARPGCTPAPEGGSGGTGAALGAAGRSPPGAWSAQFAPPVPRGWLAVAPPRVLTAFGRSHPEPPLLLSSHHPSGNFAESDNHSPQL